MLINKITTLESELAIINVNNSKFYTAEQRNTMLNNNPSLFAEKAKIYACYDLPIAAICNLCTVDSCIIKIEEFNE